MIILNSYGLFVILFLIFSFRVSLLFFPFTFVFDYGNNLRALNCILEYYSVRKKVKYSLV